jgi:hypothetical protein
MRTNEHSDTDAADSTPKSILTPRTRPQNGLRTKMLMLIGMLGLVLFAMSEAGKPENWAWMGFDKQAAPISSEAASPATPRETVRQPNDDRPPATVSIQNDLASDSASTANPTSVASPSPATTSNSTITIAPDSDLPIESVRFWSQQFAELNKQQRNDLFKIVGQLGGEFQASAPKVTPSQIALIAAIKKDRSEFNNRLLDLMNSPSHDANEKAAISANLFEADQLWAKKIMPSLEAFAIGDDITLSQQLAIKKLQNVLDEGAFGRVQDKTALGWTGDSIAWKRMWAKIHSGLLKTTPPQNVTRIQLIGQPDVYRGKTVSLQGFVRSIESRTTKPDSAVLSPDVTAAPALPDHFAIWLEPFESKSGPLCVIAPALPANLTGDGQPLDRATLLERNLLARIDGVFFKNRSYQAADQSVRNAPVILSNQIRLQSQPDWSPMSAWSLSRTSMAASIAIIPLIAIGLAWLAFRSSATRKRIPSDKGQQQLNVFLGDLKDDPNVQTDLEKVQSIRVDDHE